MRASLSLDGVWQARLDPEDVGLAQGWQAPGTEGFDRELRVPLPWQVADPELRRYAGVVWYRRSFEVPTAWRTHAVALRFGAVDYAARVWVNGHEVGGHEGGYTPFELDATEHVHWNGANEVVVRVRDPADMGEIPHGKQGGRWYTPVSGPWQSVALLARPRERVERVRVQADADGLVRAEARCRPVGGARQVRAQVLDGETVVAEAEGLVSPEVPVARLELRVPAPRPWSPEAPHLYTLRLRLGDDELDERFGLRTIEAREGELYLNGRPLYVRGALDQAYWPETLYTVPSDEEIEREIRLAKEMGLNLLRKHIKPEDPRYLEACDRLGMLVWEEPANPDRFTPAAREALRRDLFEMVERDFNHPSVVIWSLYNEDWGVPELWHDRETQEWVAGLYEELRRVDPTRPICDNSGWAHVVTDLNDYHEYYAAPERFARFRERLDFVLAHPDDNFARGWRSRGEPVLVSEFGNWGLPDPALARERSGGQEPHWFHFDQSYQHADALPPQPVENTPTDRIKTVAGFEERFRALGLDRVFKSTEELCQHLQRRAFRALKAQIDEMRRRPRIRGYVVTELTDIEWEGNGWLDYWRQEKLFHRWIGQTNGALALIAAPERPSYWCGERVAVGLWIHNTTDRPVDGVVRWRVEGTDLRGELPASAPAFALASVPDAVRFAAPDDRRRRRAQVELELVAEGRSAARTQVELAFAPGDAAGVAEQRLGALGFDRVFRQRLERFGYRVRGRWRDAPVVVTPRLDEALWSYLEGGGRVLFLADGAADGAALAGLRFMELPAGESWRMASGAAWARLDRLWPAPLYYELGWEAAAVFPSRAIEAEALRGDDEQLAGWIEGWLANAGAFAAARRVGQGRLVATTFRLEGAYGVDPVATLLLDRLVQIALE